MNPCKNIEENLLLYQNACAKYDADLLPVSKKQPLSELRCAYNFGVRKFGENRVKELVEKATQMPQDIQWHFIGPLQTNKVKKLLPHVHLIHSVDRIKLLQVINSESSKINKKTKILLELHIAQEQEKIGFDKKEILDLFSNLELDVPHIQFCGLMGMATHTDDEVQIRREFEHLKNCFFEIKQSRSDLEQFDILSMGMSGDYQIALEQGSNMVRIGSAIFGSYQ